MKKSFKERNPDVDMDEIQNNPNVPDDVKAAISGALTLTPEEEEPLSEEGEEPVESAAHGENFLESYDNDFLMDLSEEDERVSTKKSRRKRSHEHDEDWYETTKERSKQKKSAQDRRKKKEKEAKKLKKKLEAREEKRRVEASADKKPRNKTPKKAKKVSTEDERSSSETKPKKTKKTDSGEGADSDKQKKADVKKVIEFNQEPGFNGTGEIMVKIEIEPDFGGTARGEVKVKKRPSTGDKEKVPKVKTKTKPFSSIDAICATIETVARGLDDPSIAIDQEQMAEIVNDGAHQSIDSPTDKSPEVKSEIQMAQTNNDTSDSKLDTDALAMIIPKPPQFLQKTIQSKDMF